MDSKSCFKGLIYDDLLLLAKFVVAYERVVSGISTLEEYKSKFPKTFEYYEQNLDSFVAFGTPNKDGESILDAESKRQTYKIVLSKYDFQIKNLSRHIRNCFCHARLYKSNNSFFFEDYYKEKQIMKCSAFGNLPCDVTIEFIRRTIEESNLNFEK